MNEEIGSNVDKLQAQLHKVYTAETARAYKTRLQTFEYMLDQLGSQGQRIPIDPRPSAPRAAVRPGRGNCS